MRTYIFTTIGDYSTIILAVIAKNRDDAERLFTEQYGKKYHEMIYEVCNTNIEGIIVIGEYGE
jgi:hypothetical protein